MYIKYFNSISKKIIQILGILFISGFLCGLCEYLSGKYMRYSIEAAQLFYLVNEDLETTALYFWELDYFRICTISTVVISTIIFFVYLARCHKFKRFDSLKLIITLLSIILGFNSFLAFYYFLFLIVSPHLIAFLIWFSSMMVTTLSIYLIVKFINHNKCFRNYAFGTKTYFVSLLKEDILGFFEYNEFQGIIKFGESDMFFEKDKDSFIIYLPSKDIKTFEEEFIFKFGYWIYYIDKVESRLSSKEIDYHQNAIVNGENLVEEYKNNLQRKSNKKKIG